MNLDRKPLWAVCLLAACAAACAPGEVISSKPDAETADAETQDAPVAEDAAEAPDTALPDARPEAAVDAAADAAPADTGPVRVPVGADRGTVDLMKFGLFGDVRPALPDLTFNYPTGTITQVFDAFQRLRLDFVVASGDYMFSTNASTANAQVDLLLGAESHFSGFVFHALGNHECTGLTNSNCPNGNETGMIQVYRQRLIPGRANMYFDWIVHTRLGDAHFIAVAPNAWNTAQSIWLSRALSVRSTYTIVIAHEPFNVTDAPGTAPIENALSMRSGGITLRLYGHTHEYRRIDDNAIIAGNGGAPLSLGGWFGYVMVEQQPDGTLEVRAYPLGGSPAPMDVFVVRPDGTRLP